MVGRALAETISRNIYRSGACVVYLHPFPARVAPAFEVIHDLGKNYIRRSGQRKSYGNEQRDAREHKPPTGANLRANVSIRLREFLEARGRISKRQVSPAQEQAFSLPPASFPCFHSVALERTPDSCGVPWHAIVF